MPSVQLNLSETRSKSSHPVVEKASDQVDPKDRFLWNGSGQCSLELNNIKVLLGSHAYIYTSQEFNIERPVVCNLEVYAILNLHPRRRVAWILHRGVIELSRRTF